MGSLPPSGSVLSYPCVAIPSCITPRPLSSHFSFALQSLNSTSSQPVRRVRCLICLAQLRWLPHVRPCQVNLHTRAESSRQCCRPFPPTSTRPIKLVGLAPRMCSLGSFESLLILRRGQIPARDMYLHPALWTTLQRSRSKRRQPGRHLFCWSWGCSLRLLYQHGDAHRR